MASTLYNDSESPIEASGCARSETQGCDTDFSQSGRMCCGGSKSGTVESNLTFDLLMLLLLTNWSYSKLLHRRAENTLFQCLFITRRKLLYPTSNNQSHPYSVLYPENSLSLISAVILQQLQIIHEQVTV